MKGFSNTLYGYADVGYFGLAHSLLAWARCRLWTIDNNVPMLAPNWLHWRGRIGPHLRRERDKRQYQLLFRFPGYINGLSRLYLLGTLPKVKAEEVDLEKIQGQDGRKLVLFSNKVSLNTETHFHEIVGRHVDVRHSLSEITRPQYRPKNLSIPHIGIHIRLGDFSQGAPAQLLKNGGRNSCLPIDWYVSMLQGVREQLGNVPALVYSDGSDDALSAILRLERVERAPKQSAVTDLLSIGQSRLLISSGSGFSQWGSYLGHVPRICFPGQRFIRVLGEPNGLDIEPECETPSELPNDFIAHLQSGFNTDLVPPN